MLHAQEPGFGFVVGDQFGRAAVVNDLPLADDVDAVGVAEHEGELLFDQ